jgi:D-aspartate ligase
VASRQNLLRREIKMPKILILDGETVQAITAVDSAIQLGFEVTIICNTVWSYGYGTKATTKYVFASDHYGTLFANFFTQLIIKNDYDCVLPLNDYGANFLNEFASTNTEFNHLCKNSRETFLCATNKSTLMELCEKVGIPHPKTFTPEALGKIEELPYPVLVKPNHGSGARGIKMVGKSGDLLQVVKQISEEFGPCHIQEKISSKSSQYKVQVYLDDDQNVIASTMLFKERYYPVGAGSSSCCHTCYDDVAVNQCIKLAKVLNWKGFIDFDLIKDVNDGRYKIIEINPRLPACFRAATVANIDYVKLILQEQTDNALINQPKLNITLRHLGFEILWLFSSLRRGHFKRSWLKFHGTRVYYQDLPKGYSLAFFFGTVGNIKKILNVKFLRNKTL